jgi:hypothetical protein
VTTTTITYRRTANAERYSWRLNGDVWEQDPFTCECTEQTQSADEKIEGEVSLIKLVKITTVVLVQEEVVL